MALAGLSAGASMAALLAIRHPARFRAIAMHSGIAPGMAQSLAGAFKAMRGLGHAWSGGAASQAYSDPKGPDASRMIWTFAARQFATAI
jgi:poly(3-hydroxybutyrate) depolymerase